MAEVSQAQLRRRSKAKARRRAEERAQEDEARKLARDITAFVNGGGRNEGALLDELRKSHRTLQQGVTRLFVGWFEMLADAERFDLRNEASVKLARKFVDRLDVADRALPFI